MEKIRILEISSEEYPGGRVDSLIIPSIDSYNEGISQSHLIPLFRSLGFSKEVENELDLDFENDKLYPPGTHFFFYGNLKVKAHIIIQEDGFLLIILDTKIKRERINKFIEKYFIFP